MKKKVLWIAGLIVLISYVLLFSPYNIPNYLNAENKVKNIFAMDELRKEAFGEESDIIHVKYLGNYLYLVETEAGTYQVEIIEKKGSRMIQVFKHIQRIQQIQ